MNEERLFNQEAEIGLLAILLKDVELVHAARELQGRMFSSSQNAIIFDAMLTLASLGNTTDRNTVVSYLKNSKLLDKAGGEEYIDYLVKQDYSSRDISVYLESIQDSFKSRELIQLSSKIPNMVLNAGEVNSVISFVRASVDNISMVNSLSGTVAISDTLEDSWQNIKEKMEHPESVGIDTGYRTLNSITGGYNAGEVWFIAARPSHGKSAFMVNSALALADAGVPSLIFSLEMPRQSLIERLISIKSGVPLLSIRLGKLNTTEANRVQATMRAMKDYPIYIDTNYNADINYVESTLRKYNSIHGVKVSFLDYIQLLAERGNDATHALGRISRVMKLLSNGLGITNIILSQVNRNCELREDKRPIMADLRQSGNLEEDADIVAALYRDAVYNNNTEDRDKLEFIIRKHRNGPIGMIPLSFTEETTLIYD